MSLVGFQAQNHPQQAIKPDVDDRALPPEDFAPLQERFDFTVDAAAAPHNAKLPRFFTAEDDGLSLPWAGERIYCNPPYSDVRPWVEKAWSEANAFVVMLLPANRTEQLWWQELVEPFRDRAGSRFETKQALYESDPIAFAGYIASIASLLDFADAAKVECLAQELFMASVRGFDDALQGSDL